MRVCPKCGYLDNEGWQPSRYRAEVEILHIDTFKQLHPNIIFDIDNLAQDKVHAYLFRESSQMVERVPLTFFKVGGKSAFGIPREKYYKSRLDPKQRTLLEVGA